MELLGGIGSLLLVLLVGTLFGRLHGSAGGEVKAVGDRVACGLLAVPLVSLAVRLAFPTVHLAWALSAPFPLVVYVVLLAGTDMGWKVSQKYFTLSLVLASLVAYSAMAVGAALSCT